MDSIGVSKPDAKAMRRSRSEGRLAATESRLVMMKRLSQSCKNIIPALTPNRCRNFQLYCTCEPRNPEWETSVGDKCGRQVWETSGRQV